MEEHRIRAQLERILASAAFADSGRASGFLRFVVERTLQGQTIEIKDLSEVSTREHRGGLPTMTPDGEHIVCPPRELRGFYAAGGCCVGGLSIAPIIGDLLAECIMTGKPPMDPGFDRRS